MTDIKKYIFTPSKESDEALYKALEQAESKTKESYITFIMNMRARYSKLAPDTIRGKLEKAGVNVKTRKSEFMTLITKSGALNDEQFYLFLIRNNKKDCLTYLRGGNMSLSKTLNLSKTQEDKKGAPKVKQAESAEEAKLDSFDKISACDLIEYVMQAVNKYGLSDIASGELLDTINTLQGITSAFNAAYKKQVEREKQARQAKKAA